MVAGSSGASSCTSASGTAGTGTDGLPGKCQRLLESGVQQCLNVVACGQGVAVAAVDKAGLRPAVVIPAGNLDHVRVP